MEYLVGQQVAPGLVVVHEDTLKLLREQADTKNDLRAELSKLDLQVRDLQNEKQLMTSHANEGWNLANARTAQWKDAERLNGELLKWAQEQVRSHQRIFHEACDQKDERSGDIHNSLASAYISLVKEIEKQTEKRKDIPPIEDPQPIGRCKGCGFPIYTEVGYCGGCLRS